MAGACAASCWRFRGGCFRLLPDGVSIAANGDVFAEEEAEDPDWEWIEYVVVERLPKILEKHDLGGYLDREGARD